jgi:hypothetical protein
MLDSTVEGEGCLMCVAYFLLHLLVLVERFRVCSYFFHALIVPADFIFVVIHFPYLGRLRTVPERSER